ncbi:MAG TPA: DUF1707 and FHA domain-containing protein [Solirubrobacteraceae bacterium]|nr:DUF1707 and FHA domain-containing protein [Solirubrobacteraceae bacterium]
MRPSADTREATVARLHRGYVAGRLGTDTFAQRVEAALDSPDREAVRGLTADLPAPRAGWWRRRLARHEVPRSLGLPAAGELRAASLLIGRSSACQLVLADDTVSRRHAELRVEDGCWVLRDVGSSNGTWVNGRRVIEAEVRPGDVVQLGASALRL